MSILVSPDPIAKNDVAPTDFPAIVQGSGPTAIPVLANDQDKQAGPLTITSVTQGTKGTVAITGGGTGLTYDPTGFATGTDSFRYTITDNQSRSNSATVVVVIRRATPMEASPMATIASPGTLGSTTARVRISWTTIDPGTGLRSYQLQESYRGGPFRSVRLARARSTSALRTFTLGKGYRYRLKVTDTAGNVSPWVTTPSFVTSRSQESSVGIVYSGPWALASSITYSGGKARWSTAAGASATFSFTGEGVAWVSSKGPTRGAAQVLIDGVLVKTVSLFRLQEGSAGGLQDGLADHGAAHDPDRGRRDPRPPAGRRGHVRRSQVAPGHARTPASAVATCSQLMFAGPLDGLLSSGGFVESGRSLFRPVF